MTSFIPVRDKLEKSSSVVQSNQLARGFSKLTLSGLRVLASFLSQIDSKRELDKNQEFVLSAHKYAHIFGITDMDRAYVELKRGALDIMDKDRVMIIDEQGRDSWVHLVSKITPNKGKAEVSLNWGEYVIPHISKLSKNFTRYNIGNLSFMRSKHSLQLYQVLKSHMGNLQFANKSMTIEEFKFSMGIDANKYSEIRGLRRKVIEPAVRDIQSSMVDIKIGNGRVLTDEEVAKKIKLTPKERGWGFKKTGRKITGIWFKLESVGVKVDKEEQEKQFASFILNL